MKDAELLVSTSFVVMLAVLGYCLAGALVANGNNYRKNKFCFVLIFWPLIFLSMVVRGFCEFVKESLK
jgi:hypothetical protein